MSQTGSPTASPLTAVDGGTRIQVHAQPGAKRTEVVGLHGDAVKIRVQAAPVEGRANDELVRFLARTCGVTRAHVEILKGTASRTKSFLIRGVSPADVQRALAL
jgi:uncharacterized protein (TIGR00251 family)